MGDMGREVLPLRREAPPKLCDCDWRREWAGTGAETIEGFGISSKSLSSEPGGEGGARERLKGWRVTALSDDVAPALSRPDWSEGTPRPAPARFKAGTPARGAEEEEGVADGGREQ